MLAVLSILSPFTFFIVQDGSNLSLCMNVTIQMKATEQCFPVVLFIYALQGGPNV